MANTLQKRVIANLGWRPDPPDPRDHVFSAPGGVIEALPEYVDLTPDFAPYSQGRIGSCTANALAAAVQFDREKAGLLPPFIPSRLFIYYNERDVEGSVASDSGAYLRDGIKTLAALGVCPEESWPYDDTPAPYEGGPFQPDSPPAARPSERAYADAAPFLISSYQRLNQSLSQLQGCLASGRPFVFGFTVFSGWYNQRPHDPIIRLPGGADRSVGGHAVLCVGYDNARGMFKIRNSWGSDEGDHGYFYMPYAYLTSRNLASDFWVIETVRH